MSFQQVFHQNAPQQGALEVDEALAFLDGFDLSINPCNHFEDTASSSSCLSSNDCTSSNSWSSSSSSSPSSWSDELCAASPDDSLFAHLTESTACEFSVWELAPQFGNQQQQAHHEPQQSPTEPQTQIQQPQGKKKKTGRVRKDAGPKIKKPRKHNRIEILKLRELVEQLQARKSELQKSTPAAGALFVSVAVAAAAQQFIQKGAKQRKTNINGGAVSSVAPLRSVWLGVAVEQYKLLQQSERLNRKLRDAVTKQLKVTNSLQALLQKKVSSQELEEVGVNLESPAASTTSLYSKLLNPYEVILTALYRSVESQFHETDMVLRGIRISNDVTSAFSTSHMKQDAVKGPTFELTASTPVQSHFQLVGLLMWKRAVKKSPSGVRQECTIREPQLKQKCSSSTHFSHGFFENHVQMTVPSRFGELKVNGVIVICKFEEVHRTVMTMASTYTLDDSCLMVRENGWTIVSSDDGNTRGVEKEPAPATFQTFIRVRSENQDPSSSTGSSPFTKTPDEKTAYIQEVVTNALGDQMRQQIDAVQKSLLSEVKPISTRVMEFKANAEPAMSFQLSLLDAQHGELEMNEALAFLDGFELCTPCDQPFEDDNDSGTSRPVSHNGSSNKFSTASSCSADLSSATPDDSLTAHLSDSTGCEGLAADWEAPPQICHHEQQQQLQMHLDLEQREARSQELIQLPQKKKKKTATAAKPAAGPKIRKPRKHNRIEILKLRELVEQLQSQCAELQKAGVTTGRVMSVAAAVAAQVSMRKDKATKDDGDSTSITASSAAPPRFVWLEFAKEQYKKRQHSEELNCKLRDAVTKQLKVTNSLQALLQKKVSSQDLEFLLKAPPAPPTKLQHALLNPQELIRTALYRSVKQQFHETDRVCHTINTSNDVLSVFTTSSTKQDAVLGPTFELISNTPVRSNFQLIGRLMWTRAIEKRDPSVVRSLSELQLAQAHFSRGFHEKRVQMIVPSRFGELQLEGVVVVCKFEEAHRIVMTVASAYTLNNTSFVFRENAWIVVSEAKNSTKNENAETEDGRQSWEPSPSALFQALFRINSEKRDPRSSTGSSPFTKAPDEDTEYLRQVVANTLGDHMQQHMAVLQKSLLSEVESLVSSMMEFNYPLAECTC